jgi:Leucine-rich repeat (LRR) protein
MSQLKNLVYLDLGRNRLDEIPSFVKDLPKLKELRFGWNLKVNEIPSFLGDLPELTTLRLEGDDFSDLPDFLSKLPHLSLISLGDNCRITGDDAKMNSLRTRFPKIKLDFDQEYDCPAK